MSDNGGFRILDVDEALTAGFLAYAAERGPAHDDSYVLPEELAQFDSALEPAVVALDEDDQIIGAASAMVRGYVTEGNARFRVLSADDPAVYPELIARVLERLPAEVYRAFMFLPERHTYAADALSAAGFAETRRAYIFANTDPASTPEAELPSETEVFRALPSMAEDWAHIVNEAYRGVPGHYDMTTERAIQMLTRERVLPGGTLMMFKGGSPAGLVLTAQDQADLHWAEIETLAVRPFEQGKGLGRSLLRRALIAAALAGYTHVSLSVAATNRRALTLYLNSGFHAEDVRVCWELQRRLEPAAAYVRSESAPEAFEQPVMKVWDFTEDAAESESQVAPGVDADLEPDAPPESDVE